MAGHVQTQHYPEKADADWWFEAYQKDGLPVTKEYDPAASKWDLVVEYPLEDHPLENP